MFSGTAAQVGAELSEPRAFPIAEFSALPGEASDPERASLEARRLLAQAAARIQRREHEESIRLARIGLVLATESGDTVLAWRARATLALALARAGADPAEATSLVRGVESWANSHPQREEARELRLLAKLVDADLSLNEGAVTSAATQYEEAWHLQKPLPPWADGHRVHILFALASVHQQQGNLVRALTRLQAVRVLADKWDAPDEQFHARFGAANLLAGFQRYDEALPLLDGASKIADHYEPLLPLRAACDSISAACHLAKGALEEALASAQAAYDRTLANGDAAGHVQAAAMLAAVHKARKTFPEAYRALSFAAGRLELGGQAEAGQLVRRMVGELKDFMGAEAFDSMAAEMARAELEKRRLRGDTPR
jgi:tetratricopeptide (TPR) repeat protein